MQKFFFTVFIKEEIVLLQVFGTVTLGIRAEVP